MSSAAEKLGVNLAEAIALLGQLTQQFVLEKRALEAEKDKEIEALKRQLEAEKAKHRASAVSRHMIVARDLSITWSDTPEYWQWTTVPELSHAVAKLLRVCWLHITGRLQASQLTPNTTYTSYLVYKLTENRIPPGEAYAGPVGGANSMSKVCLVPENQAGSARADQYPKQRPDGWMEVKLGEFLLNGGSEIEMRFQELGGQWKHGLIVRGMEVRAKH